MNQDNIFNIERPHPDLMKLYFIRALLTGPAFPFTLIFLFFRYHTLRYRIDNEGLGMKWGILFRREVNLTYTRIQDIHLTSGIIQRWFGLADIQIQTASGKAEAEMVIEGLREYEAIRNFLYSRMRGLKNQEPSTPAAPRAPAPATGPAAPATIAVLQEILLELRSARQAIEELGKRKGS